MLFTIYSAKSRDRKRTTGNHALSKEDFLSHAHPLVVHELFSLLIWILKQVRKFTDFLKKMFILKSFDFFKMWKRNNRLSVFGRKIYLRVNKLIWPKKNGCGWSPLYKPSWGWVQMFFSSERMNSSFSSIQ